ncbi:S-layer homology domain-containing protein [Paenibacillus sp. PR3]|uniref:S-layer homology domain-containing protein n=1 Tax=Paenibacillus terricola TaxID=2763503 RepID=A0ABR8N3H2_9BACL|nr:S-layer homology domain-containing protein [Paenibacillus terricola]MBD3921389.1 S-layer homology domain-containing protein [Paenibacillus terricola]
MKHSRQWATAALAVTLALSPVAASPAYAGSTANTSVDIFSDLQGLSKEQVSQIANAVKAGLLQGDSSHKFRPNDVLTRQEMAVLLTRALQLPTGEKSVAFSDVSPSHWASGSIQAVQQAGLMLGYSDATFRPTAPVTREQLAVLLMRAAQLPIEAAGQAANLFDWSHVSPWAQSYVNAAINYGVFPTSGGNFQPKASVLRKEIAQSLLNTFLPQSKLALLQQLENGKVTINGVAYRIPAAMQGLLRQANREALEGAEIQFVSNGHVLQSITKLVIHASGIEPAEQAPEFSGNLVLDGNGAAVDGDLVVAGNYITVRNLKVKKDLQITPELENDFYARNLEVEGNTLIYGGDDNTVVFSESQLKNVEINKENVHVELLESTSVQAATVLSNATLSNHTSSALQQVTVAGGAEQVTLQGSVQNVAVNTQQASTLSVNGTVGSMTINTSEPLNLNGGGTISTMQVTNPAANVQVDSTVQVQGISYDAGVPTSTVKLASASTPAVNTAPRVVVPFASQLTTVGDSDLTIGLTGHFIDDEQTVLKYAVTSLNNKICKAVLVGDSIVLTPVARGTVNIAVVADDQAGKKANTTFTVTVNEPPKSSGIPSQTKSIGTGNVTVALNDYFKDADQDMIVYEASVADTLVAKYALNGDQLVLMPVKVGVTTVTIKASDGRGGSLTDIFQLTVSPPPNQNPVVQQTPSGQTLTVGKSDYMLDLSPLFSDPDADALTYEVSSSNTGIATVTLTGTQAKVHAVATGAATIQLKAKDGKGGEATTQFQVTVNEPPTIAALPAQSLQMGSAPSIVNLSSYLSDKENDTLTVSATSNQTGVVKVSVTGKQLTLTPVATGSTTIAVTVSDGRGGQTTAQLAVTVSPPPNQKPVVQQTPSGQTLTVGKADYTLDLSPLFSDPDADALTYEVSSSNTGIATVTLTGTQAKVHAVATGAATIQLKAKDGKGGEATTQFQVTVNEPPTIAALPAQSLQMGSAPSIVNLSSYLSDKENDTLTVSATSNQTGVVKVSVTGKQLTLTPVATGSTTIAVTVSDGRGGQTTAQLAVTVSPPPNQKPVVQQTPSGQTLTVGKADYMLDLSPLFSDPDADALTYEVSSSNTGIATVTLTGTQAKVHAVATGAATIQLKAKDGKGGEATTQFQVTVNEPPTIAALPAQSLQMGSAPSIVNLSSYLSDKENDTLTVTATSNQTGVVKVSVTGKQLTLTPVATGSTTIAVTVSDGRGGQATAQLTVTVSPPPNQNPVVQQTPSDQTLTVGQADYILDLSPLFSDPGADALTYEVSSSNTGIATVALTGTQAKVHAVATGAAAIQLKAKDGKGGETTTQFQVTVNEPPTIATLPAQGLQMGDAPTNINLSSYLSDPENDALTVTATSNDTSVVTVSVTGKQLTLTPVATGSTTIAVTVSDGRGGQATAQLTVTVSPPPNQNPVVQQTPSDQTLTVGQADYILDLSPLFSDPDADALTYEVSSSNTGIATVALTGTQAKVHAVATGAAAIQLKAQDGKGGEVTTQLQVTVNEPPVIATLPAQGLQMGDAPTNINLSSNLSDPENDALTVTATSNDTSVVTVSVTGKQLTLTPVATGSTTIAVTVSDGRGGQTTAQLTVTVSPPPNQNPVVQQTPSDQTLTVGQADYMLDLSPLFSDPDADALTYEVSSSNTGIATVTLTGTQAKVHAVATGAATIQLKAQDGKGGEATTQFQVTVNEPPVIATLPAQGLQMGDAPTNINLSSYLSDPENDALTVTATSNDTSVVTVSVTGKQLTLTPVATGSTTIAVTVSDGRGGQATAQLTVTVSPPPNQNPVVQQTPSDQTLTVGQADYMLDLSPLFSDPDADALTYEVSSSNTGIATVTLTGTQAKVHAVATGAATIQLKAQDGKGGEATTQFQVTVNEPPVIATLPAQGLQMGDAPTNINLSSYLSDPENDALTVTATSNDTSVVTVSVTGKQLTLTPVATGSTTIAVTVSDGRGGQATAQLTVTVQAAASQNQAPNVTASIYEQVLTAGVTNARSYDLTQLFEDPDGDALTFTAVPAAAGIVQAAINGGMITLTPSATAGSTTVLITADDGKGGTATYSLTVRNAPLAANGLVNIRTKQGVKESILYDLAAVFPNQTQFKVYTGTPDSTFTGPTTLNGTKWTWDGMPLNTWIIGADGTAAVLSVAVDPQGAEELYFSQYMDAGNGRTALQLYFNPVGDTSQTVSGYTLEVYQYNKNTGQKSSYSKALLPLWKGMPYLFIDQVFYDFFDITNATYYNEELALFNGGTTLTTGFVLKKNGVIIDVLGDPNATTAFMPNGGTIIRKSGIRAGNTSFQLYGEWTSYPVGTLQYIAGHTS